MPMKQAISIAIHCESKPCHRNSFGAEVGRAFECIVGAPAWVVMADAVESATVDVVDLLLPVTNGGTKPIK